VHLTRRSASPICCLRIPRIHFEIPVERGHCHLPPPTLTIRQYYSATADHSSEIALFILDSQLITRIEGKGQNSLESGSDQQNPRTDRGNLDTPIEFLNVHRTPLLHRLIAAPLLETSCTPALITKRNVHDNLKPRTRRRHIPEPANDTRPELIYIIIFQSIYTLIPHPTVEFFRRKSLRPSKIPKPSPLPPLLTA